MAKKIVRENNTDFLICSICKLNKHCQHNFDFECIETNGFFVYHQICKIVCHQNCKSQTTKKKEVYDDREFSFQLNTTMTGATNVIRILKEFLENTNWNYKYVKIQLVE